MNTIFERFTPLQLALFRHLKLRHNFSVREALDAIVEMGDVDTVEYLTIKHPTRDGNFGYSFTMYEENEATQKLEDDLLAQLEEMISDLPDMVQNVVNKNQFVDDFIADALGEKYARANEFGNGEEYEYDIRDHHSEGDMTILLYEQG